MHWMIAQAAEAAAEVAPQSTGQMIIGGVVMILVMIITKFLVPFLKAKEKAAHAEAEKNMAEAGSADVASRGVLVNRLQEFLWGNAAAIAEKRFPVLAMDIVAGKFKSLDAVKAELKLWGIQLKQSAKEYFSNQGIDIVAAIGDKFLDSLIERAANAVSPFPGKETAKELLTEKVSNMLIDKGVDFVRARYLDDTTPMVAGALGENEGGVS